MNHHSKKLIITTHLVLSCISVLSPCSHSTQKLGGNNFNSHYWILCRYCYFGDYHYYIFYPTLEKKEVSINKLACLND